MIFIPFFKKIDWTQPPVITLLLILVNCVIFVVFQSDDAELTEQAYQYYLESELPTIEIPLYVEYLKQQNEWKKLTPYGEYLDAKQNADHSVTTDKKQHLQLNKLRRDTDEFQLVQLAGPMIMDSGFQQQLSGGKLFADHDSFSTWKKLNTEFQNRLNKVVTYRHGLKPNAPTISSFFTNMFLHGGYDHLIGNMIFLFIIGFVVEAALGKFSFSIGYVVAGLIGGILYVISNANSQIPTIGASGAIAGLMGMYTVLFGLRKINFFYFIFVYFDYVKAPAIILLPIWLGHEFLQLFWNSNSGVNYFAHIGGLSSGALFAFIVKHYFNKVNIDYLDQEIKEEAKANQLETALEYLGDMQVTKALALLKQLCNEHPQNREYLMQWYKAAKLQPDSDDYHTAAARIMQIKDKDPKAYQLIFNTYQEYMKFAKPKPRINAQLCLHLIWVFTRGKYFEEAEKLIAVIKNHKLKEPVAEAILTLATAFQKSNQPSKCLTYLKLLTQDFSQTASSIEAHKRLQTLNK